MSAEQRQQKFLVRLVRPVFQVAYLEVEAEDEYEAVDLAEDQAGEIPEENWKGRFNPELYRFEGHCVRSDETPEGNPYSLIDFPYYALLTTDQELAPPHSPFEPWMSRLYPTSLAGQLHQWIDQLTDLRSEVYDHSLKMFGSMLNKLRDTDEKVVPLMPPAERKFDVDLLEALIEVTTTLKEID